MHTVAPPTHMQYIVFTTHWGACIFYWIARTEGFPATSWVGRDYKRFDGQPMMVQYTYALFWSVTCFSNYGDGVRARMPACTAACRLLLQVRGSQAPFINYVISLGVVRGIQDAVRVAAPVNQ